MGNRVDNTKARAAEEAAAMVENGMRLGLGSGSTALLFVDALARRVGAGLTLPPAVATSTATAERAARHGISIADMMGSNGPAALDLAVDGADEIDPSLRLIKGGGASLLREKIVAQMARRMVVIADASKWVIRLGHFPLPVEVVRFGWGATSARITDATGVAPALRMANGAPLVTDNGNHILDCPLGSIDDPDEVAAALLAIPGVVEHGLFLSEADEAILAGEDGLERLTATP